MVYAVFLDILGTSKYFTDLPDDFDFEKDNSQAFETYLWARQTFHEGIASAAKLVSKGLVFRASFSDCAFLVYKDPSSLLAAVHIAMSCFNGVVPVRGGIGKGNFGLGQSIHIADKNTYSTEASFYGSSIIRAHQAERCGLKGIRVFVHYSAAHSLLNTHKGIEVHPVRDWSGYEEGDPPPLRKYSTIIDIKERCLEETKHEVCYIGSDEIDIYLRGLEMVQSSFSPSGRAILHYGKTKSLLHHFQELREKSNKRMNSD